MLMLKTIAKNLANKYSTRCHPFEQRVLAEGFRGKFKFVIDKCIMCRACSLKCPTQCLRVEPETGLWAQDLMACVHCGICAEVCPTGCIIMTNVYEGPMTEPTYLEFKCKPKMKKMKANATEEEKQEAVVEAILEKQKEKEEEE